MDHIFLIHSSVEGRLGISHMDIMNTAAMNIIKGWRERVSIGEAWNCVPFHGQSRTIMQWKLPGTHKIAFILD